MKSFNAKNLILGLGLLVVITFFILFNFTNLLNAQINSRNEKRQSDIQFIVNQLKKYIANNSNLPTTSVPEDNSFLPELIFEDSRPKGGISIAFLESMEEYFDVNLKDPGGEPYLIGVFENTIIVYTNNIEAQDGSKTLFYEFVSIPDSLGE